MTRRAMRSLVRMLHVFMLIPAQMDVILISMAARTADRHATREKSEARHWVQ